MIEASLAHLGLDEKETALYLAALKLGETNMTTLAQRAGLKRSTAYIVFSSLQKKGLIGSAETRRGLVFRASSPDVLLAQARTHVTEIELAIPELTALAQKPSGRPQISYYEGEASYRLVLEDSLKRPGITLRHIGSLTELHKTMSAKYDLESYLPRRVAKKIFLKALYFEQDVVPFKDRNNHRDLREVRFLPAQYAQRTTTLMYENTTIITSSQKELITVVIQSADIAAAEKARFDLIWDLVGNK